jgi:hypothetical protein
LTATCPAPVTLRHNGGAQSVARTVHATDGGAATVTVSPINIDRARPTVSVAGVQRGHHYDAPGPTARCVGHDPLSGIRRCILHARRRGNVVRYTAVATDNAGNVSTRRTHITVTRFSVAGVPFRHGYFVVHRGDSYVVHAITTSKHPPVYLNAAPQGVNPHPAIYRLKKAGHDDWAIRISITPLMSHYRFWDIAIRAGGHVHLIHLRIEA